ncbi:SH3 domain-containing protein [Pseudonocardia hierapolitana]|uniref:SH3 domain-containing protein n=1 Tax=Pseudonocardia hierapolitana TaxID=1128676 RepID=A0A561T1P5_9PSEU|nr:SH3 domain-containing protein [Pseudonocardia hierapolitana]TWF81030.1 SH3 domain-containing protein [Pseudonocardia hierapolitana]
MKAPKSLFDRPGRATAVVGAVIAVSATAAVALLSGTATATPSAEQPGRCTKNVNVRAEPDTTSRIVALCEEGTAVKVAEARDGFLRLANLGGWAAQEYISVNGRAPAPAARATNSEDDDTEDSDDRRARRSADDARESSRGTQGSGSDGGDSDGSDSRGGSSGGSGAGGSAADESSDSPDSADPAETEDPEESEEPGRQQAPRSGGIGGLLG